MFKDFSFFERHKEDTPEEQEKLKERLSFAFDSRQDFTEAKKMAEEIIDEVKKQELMDEILAIEGGAVPKFTESVSKEEPPDEGIDFRDVMEAIEAGDFKGAKYLAHEVSGEKGEFKNPRQGKGFTSADEFWGAKSLLRIAQAEFERGQDPKKTIAEAKEVVRNIEDDPQRLVSIFTQIIKLESDFGLTDDARKTIIELKEKSARPDWREQSAVMLAIIAQVEKEIGLLDDEMEKLDTDTVHSLLKIHPELSAAVKGLRPDIDIQSI